MKAYILESEDEFKRLEEQSQQIAYSVVEELKPFYCILKKFQNGKVLDAGCGSGIVSKFLLNEFPNLDIDACDLSDIRLHQVKKTLDKKVNFFQHDLTNHSLENNKYDLIISRFVFEYFSDPVDVAKKMFNALKPNGYLCIVDVDGLFLNFFTKDKKLNTQLERISAQIKGVDLFCGRKLSNYFSESGFKKINQSIKVQSFFNEKDLALEKSNMSDRIEFAKPALMSIFKNEEEIEDFKQRYLKEMDDKNNTLFFNKFTVFAQKP